MISCLPCRAGEEWRQSVSEHHMVSNMGRVFSLRRRVNTYFGKGSRQIGGELLSPHKNKRGYLVAGIQNSKYRLVHQLVVSAFIGPIADGMTVNHKNGIKDDNRVENLEILTASQNTKHAWDTGLFNIRKAVICIDDGMVFPSVHEAARHHGKAVGNLCSTLKGRQKTFAGKRWKYVDASPWPDRFNGGGQRAA